MSPTSQRLCLFPRPGVAVITRTSLTRNGSASAAHVVQSSFGLANVAHSAARPTVDSENIPATCRNYSGAIPNVFRNNTGEIPDHLRNPSGIFPRKCLKTREAKKTRDRGRGWAEIRCEGCFSSSRPKRPEPISRKPGNDPWLITGSVRPISRKLEIS